MTLHVLKPGMQTSLQGAPFRTHRHIGMSAAGAADCLSLALANRLVGNDPECTALEITMGGATFESGSAISIACTGADCSLKINGESHPQHQTIAATTGSRIEIGPARQGCRAYLSVAGGFDVETVLGSQSTYLAAGIGGHHGRVLRAGDELNMANPSETGFVDQTTPQRFVPSISNSAVLRVTAGEEFEDLVPIAQETLFQAQWTIDQRMSRMGLMLDGAILETNKDVSLPSAAVFPGTIQLPPEGQPFLLGPDAQTTGGYPRIAQVIRADRHLIGQLRPGSKVQLVHTTPEKAAKIYREKFSLLKPWLGKIQLW